MCVFFYSFKTDQWQLIRNELSDVNQLFFLSCVWKKKRNKFIGVLNSRQKVRCIFFIDWYQQQQRKKTGKNDSSNFWRSCEYWDGLVINVSIWYCFIPSFDHIEARRVCVWTFFCVWTHIWIAKTKRKKNCLFKQFIKSIEQLKMRKIQKERKGGRVKTKTNKCESNRYRKFFHH